MNVQPKPSIDCMPGPGARTGPAFAHAHVAATAPPSSRLLAAWPVELEVEPWRP